MLAVRSGSTEGTDAMPGNPTPLAAGFGEPLFTPTQLEMSGRSRYHRSNGDPLLVSMENDTASPWTWITAAAHEGA